MMQKRYFYDTLPALGVIFCLWYVMAATSDVVYTDYIRIVNSYLPEVWSPEHFFVPDILTRIPVNYLARIINTTFFSYNTQFDMVLGVLGLGLSGWLLSGYSWRMELKSGWLCLFLLVIFSLNKWEMLINGTGWVHFLAVSSFLYHLLVLDRMLHGCQQPFDEWRLRLLPFVIIWGVAGPYCAAYTMTVLTGYGFSYWSERQRNTQALTKLAVRVSCLLIPFAGYLWSNAYAIEDHADRVSISIGQAFRQQPLFPIRFLLKSLSSAVIGIESQINEFGWSGRLMCAVGVLVMLSYVAAIWLNFSHRLYQQTLVPLLLLGMGAVNHGLIFLSRWIFLKDYYGMSSRYALQFQVGMIGILLTISLLWKELQSLLIKGVAAGICLMILTGNVITTYHEIKKAPYRKEYAVQIGEVALNFEAVDDEVLRQSFDYRRNEPESGAKVRSALEILQQQKWNVFR